MNLISENSVRNRNILFIGTPFFEYENKITKKLIDLGAKVTFYGERAIKTSFGRAILKVNPLIFKQKTKKYYKKIIENEKNEKFNFVFIYGATSIDYKIVTLLKQTFQEAVFILYIADAVYGNKRFENMFNLFHKVFTFDSRDYELYKRTYPNIRFLPLFYSDEYTTDKNEILDKKEIKYDIVFIGTVHSDRYKLLMSIKRQAELKGLNVYYYLYLQSWFMFYFYKLINKDFRRAHFKDFKYKKITVNEIVSVIKMSNAIIDVQYPKNSGLTMRTMEVFGIRKKLITTDEDVQKYDFYKFGNILIINRKYPVIDFTFLDKPFSDYPDCIYKSYGLENWIKTLFK